jgi:hypothetical protein
MGSFKQLKSSDVITVPVIANKQWNFNYCPIPEDDFYVSYHNGINSTTLFDPIGEDRTMGQYDSLTYKQINQLFYHKYSGSLNTSSLMSSLYYESASGQHPSVSFFNYNNDPAFISNFPTGSGETIKVIQISPDAYGNRILPGTLIISSSAFYLFDDSKGNIYDNFNSIIPRHVGNIFYPEGIIVVTDQDFQSMFVLPPVAFDDIYNIVRSDYGNPATFSFFPLINDDLRGNILLDNTITIFGGNSSFFSTGSQNSVSLSFSGLGLGSYQTSYTFLSTGSYCAPLKSSTGSITINVTDPECEFEINILSSCIKWDWSASGPNSSSLFYNNCNNIETIILSSSITNNSGSICVYPNTTPYWNPSAVIGSHTLGTTGVPCLIPPTPTPTRTPTVTVTRTVTPTPTPTRTVSITPTPTRTVSITPTPTRTVSITPTRTPSISITPSITPIIPINQKKFQNGNNVNFQNGDLYQFQF